MKFRLLYKGCYIIELYSMSKRLTKNMCWLFCISSIAHLKKAHTIARADIVPVPKSSPFIQTKRMKCLLKKNTHYFYLYYFIKFWKLSGTRERNYNICVVITNNTTAKMFSIVTFCILARVFNGELSYLLLYANRLLLWVQICDVTGCFVKALPMGQNIV